MLDTVAPVLVHACCMLRHMAQDHVRVASCDHCGKEVVWGPAAWPIETTPRDPESCAARAYVFLRTRTGYRAVDIRDLPSPPDLVYPQHVCRVWWELQDQKRRDERRALQVLDRMAAASEA